MSDRVFHLGLIFLLIVLIGGCDGDGGDSGAADRDGDCETAEGAEGPPDGADRDRGEGDGDRAGIDGDDGQPPDGDEGGEGDRESADGDEGQTADEDGGEGDRDAEADLPPAREITISKLIVVENPANHLSAMVFFDTDVEATAEILVEGPEGKSWTVGPTRTPAKSHEMAVLGMYADSTYAFTVKTADTERGYGESDPQPFETGPLPEDFPPMNVTVSMPELMQPGVTLFTVWRWTPGTDTNWGLILAVDETGRVVWYYRGNALMFDVKRLGDGKLQYLFSNLGVTQIDMLGSEISLSQWNAWSIGLDTIHHDMTELPGGHFLTISTEMRDIDGYPVDGGGTAEYHVVGDVIAELDGGGSLVKTWSLFDYIDPMRVREGFYETFWNLNYGSVDTTKDWTHANTVLYDPSDDTMIVSVRHHDWLMKIDMDTDELVWTFGEEGDFTLQGGGEWPFHQHSPEFLPNGNLLMYDNGNARSSYRPGDVPYTRAVEYEIDEANRTARQVWEYRGDEPYYAPFGGDANRLPNGNVLIADGGIVADPMVDYNDPDNLKSVRIVEVTYGDASQKVFELIIKDNSETIPYGYTSYRAVRLPSLYPDEAQ